MVLKRTQWFIFPGFCWSWDKLKPHCLS